MVVGQPKQVILIALVANPASITFLSARNSKLSLTSRFNSQAKGFIQQQMADHLGKKYIDRMIAAYVAPFRASGFH